MIPVNVIRVAVGTQQNEKLQVQMLWMLRESAIETQWHDKGLRGVSLQSQSTYHCTCTAVYAPYLNVPTEL